MPEKVLLFVVCVSGISHCLNVFAVLCRAWMEETVHLALQEMMDAQ